ncbi:arf-GAP with coiled-coil, ANK repeat and PH domain-containing protein 2-like [Branchiostoma floridae]|uniref:Arf-GAP with coiled-coil, ANK repeat and PH domain-containing protein 2-like n=1 Tax=Branchiostoma floridae TaxID=7739 RepID=A0A9J7NC97_BRAFL|nr:arf-GAP with coiled-coil, ANK repeat and PH domain-containing protein 2-like [Branchiostoma floridae]
MGVTIDFEECLKDSPKFRVSLEQVENDIHDLETKLEKVIKLCNGMMEAGKAYNTANGAFIRGVKELSVYFRGDQQVNDALCRFADGLTEMLNYHTILFDQAKRAISKNLDHFVKNDLKKVKDTKKHFEKISDDMDAALSHQAQTNRNKLPLSWYIFKLPYHVVFFPHDLKKVKDTKKHFEKISDDMDAALSRQALRPTRTNHLFLGTTSNLIFMLCFFSSDLKKVKDTKKHFEKISDDMDAALSRQAQANRNKPQELEETNNILTAMRSCFGHVTLDYVFQINVVQSKKRFKVMDTMLSFMYAVNTFYHQGYDLTNDLEPYMKTVAAQLEKMTQQAAAEKKEMEERHLLVQERENSLKSPPMRSSSVSDSSEVVMEGYLFKRTTNAFKTWVRRWFTIQSNQLVYQKRVKASCPDETTVVVPDLRICTVKPAEETERNFCFEIVSPTKSYTLQAESDNQRQVWIQALQASIATAFREGHREENFQDRLQDDPRSPSVLSTVPSMLNSLPPLKSETKPKNTMLRQVLQIPGNNVCCDCRQKEPRWASINLGIVLCIECSGIHRSLGVHLSKVRSLTLDAWEPEILGVMSLLGNEAVNKTYEANSTECADRRAYPDCPRSVRESWIKSKYVKKDFLRPLPGKVTADGASPARGRKRVIRRWSVKKFPERFKSVHSGEEEGEAVSRSTSSGSLHSGARSDSGLEEAEDLLVFGEEDSDEDSDLEEDRPPLSVPHILIVPDILEEFPFLRGSVGDRELSEDCDAPTRRSADMTEVMELSQLDPNMLLYKAASAGNLPVLSAALAHGADVNWVNSEDTNKTPLHQAVESGSIGACEFLLLNGAKLDVKDGKGRAPLHHATILGNTGQVCLFLKRGANQHAVDEDGQDPLAIALSTTNADIVTLLRLARMNEEMKESEGYGNPGDETFSDVFKDFSQLASNNPSRLMRADDRADAPDQT